MNHDIGVFTRRRIISPAESYFAVSAAVTVGWHDLYSQPIATDSVGWQDYTMRQGIAVAAYDVGAPATGTQVRVTMSAASSVGIIFSQAWIGHVGAGDLIDFDGSQVQLLFSGIAAGSIGASGTLVSDARNYSFDKTKALVISVHFSGASDVMKTEPLTNFTGGFHIDGTDLEAGQTDVIIDGANYGAASRLYVFSKVEVFG